MSRDELYFQLDKSVENFDRLKKSADELCDEIGKSVGALVLIRFLHRKGHLTEQGRVLVEDWLFNQGETW